MKRKLFKVLKIGAIVLFVMFLGGFIYLNMNTYDPMENASALLEHEQVDVYDDYFVVNPLGDVVANLVYYQGGLVKTASYLPFSLLLAEEGVRVFIPKMPLNLAIFDQDAFFQVEDMFDEGVPIIIAGHSLGGASASLFLSNHEVDVDGLVFLASYPANNADLSQLDLAILSITASNDGLVDLQNYEQTKELLPSHTIYAQIVGGNHAQFGHYGAQSGDLDASITRDNQQSQVVSLILEMIDSLQE